MISKNLCFKLMKEDLKRRIWTVALTILGLIFALVVPVAIRCSSFAEDIEHATQEWYKKQLTDSLIGMVGVNGFVITILLALAVVWAVSGFHYLHNSRQVDFYHSIPVKRHQLFLASYLNGILISGTVYLAAQILSVGLILNTGIGGQSLGSMWWKIFLLNMIYYSMIYTTVVIAMMMTGNIIIALLGTGVFLGYGPAVTVLIVGYRQMWFHTLYETTEQEMVWLKALRYTSPFSDYMFSLGNFSEGILSAKNIIGAVAVTIALAVIAYGLYKLRPSEAAGKAMAFKKTQSPIKVLIAIPVAVVFGMFFYTLRSTAFWGIFGTICGAVLTCCLMEIIYHFDFRKLFSNRIHLAGCVAVSVLLILAGIYDWYGFDSWLPNAAKVKSASVTLGHKEDWVTYGEPRWERDYRGREGYSWNYQNQTDYQLKHMELTDIYTIMELAKKGVQREQNFRRSGENQLWGYNGNIGTSYIIQFRLNNGKIVNRRYYIKQDEEMKELETAIHDSKEYKTGTFPILEQTASDTAAVYFQQYNQFEKLPLTVEEKEHLLAVYQKELEELTMAAREKELPIGTIQFRSVNLEEAITFNEENDNGGYGSLTQRSYYPVYPSFSRTLEIIKGAGIKFIELNSENVTSIKVEYYWMYDEDWKFEEEEFAYAYDSDSRQTIIYDKPEDIKALAPALVFRDYSNLNAYYEMETADNADIYVTVNFGISQDSKTRSDMSNFQLNLKNLSKNDIRRFRFVKEPSSD